MFSSACVCLSVFVCLTASDFAQKLLTNLDEMSREGSQWAEEQLIKF